MDKLKSRKFWVAVLSALIVVLNEQFSWGITPEAIAKIVTLAVGYLIVEGAADTAGALKK